MHNNKDWIGRFHIKKNVKHVRKITRLCILSLFIIVQSLLNQISDGYINGNNLKFQLNKYNITDKLI